ncbi:MAG: patatin-like phospholipase family protein [Burkholderiales bacterium]
MATKTMNSNYANPQQECDLVMKGGATSGLVYPRAVLELARQPEPGEKKVSYRFRAIGGTSAGAVAAAFTAAAEYNRARGGFEKLHEINLKLQGEEGESAGQSRPTAAPPTFLRDLFQGSTTTQPLLNVLIRMARYVQEVKTINTKSGSVLWRIPAYLRLALKIVRESGVPGAWKGRLYGVLAGVLVAAMLAGFIGAWPWLTTGSWAAFSWELAALGVLFGLSGFVLGGLAARLWRLCRIAMSDVPRNRFGICSGLRDPENAVYPKEQPAAMEWLHQSIQEIAGLRPDEPSAVLTFRQLEERGITLEVMVTNISEGRAYVMPFDDPFIFRKQDFDILFPAPIVEKLIRGARKIRGIELPHKDGFYFLPRGADLPIAVAARLSMSFPLLFSSVPLYALPLWVRERIEDDEFRISEEEQPQALPQSLRRFASRGTPAAGGKPSLKSALQQAERWRDADATYAPMQQDLIPHWLSDGGIASNFPIHFFDHWLPKSPTFGITLRYLPGYLFAEKKDADEERATKNYLDSMERTKEPPERNLGKRILDLHNQSAKLAPAPSGGAGSDIVVLPRPEDTVPLEWQHICYPDAVEPGFRTVPGFLWAVVKTMQNYRDNTQAALASYRERVVQVRLRPDEGGFNLAMGKTVIEGVVRKGQSAGEKLDQEFNMEHHQWGRLRVLVSELDEKFRTIRGDKRDVDFEALLKKQQDDAGYPFCQPDAAWCQEVRARLQALRTAMDQWQAQPQNVRLDAGAPPPVLRVTPNV